MRLRIEYFDHNEAFAQYLPRTGEVRRELRGTKGVGRWYLVDLDGPFDYQMKLGEPFRFRSAHINAFLIRSRWEGTEVGDPDGTSVFILLVEEAHHPTTDIVDENAYVHVAWGMCRPVPTG